MDTILRNRLDAEMQCTYERGVQVNMARFALEAIADAPDVSSARAIAGKALDRIGEPFPVPAAPFAEVA